MVDTMFKIITYAVRIAAAVCFLSLAFNFSYSDNDTKIIDVIGILIWLQMDWRVLRDLFRRVNK